MFGLRIITDLEYRQLVDASTTFDITLRRELSKFTDDSHLLRDLYQQERDRADRLLDQVVQMAGQEPVSPKAVAKRDEEESEYKKRRDEMEEIFSETISQVSEGVKSLLGDEEVEVPLENQASS